MNMTRRGKDDIKRPKLLSENVTSQMKNIVAGINSRLDTTEERSVNLRTMQNETERKKIGKTKKEQSINDIWNNTMMSSIHVIHM